MRVDGEMITWSATVHAVLHNWKSEKFLFKQKLASLWAARLESGKEDFGQFEKTNNWDEGSEKISRF